MTTIWTYEDTIWTYVQENMTVMVRYMSKLSATFNLTGNISEISITTLHELHDAIDRVPRSIEERQLINDVSMAYKTTSRKLLPLIHGHVSNIGAELKRNIITYKGKGGLAPKKDTKLRLNHIQSDGTARITFDNKLSDTYGLLMFKIINGNNTHTLKPNFTLSLCTNYNSYTEKEILEKFNFINITREHIMPYPNKVEANPEAIDIFNADKAKVSEIVKGVFKTHNEDYNILKNAEPAHQVIICVSSLKPSDVDGSIKFFICLEIFKLAENLELCGVNDAGTMDDSFCTAAA
jgi:hypothetical protein